MQITKIQDNKESVYELIYDRTEIYNLAKEIATNCSVRANQKCYVTAMTRDEAEKKVESSIDISGMKVYENVSDIMQEPVKDPLDYLRPGDPVTFSFMADKLVVPKIVNFLLALFDNHDIDYDWFTDRIELTMKDEMKNRIDNLQTEVNKLDYDQVNLRIEMLTKLADLLKGYETSPKFDYELLSSYYDKAEELINLELLQETTYYRKSLIPKK